MAVSDDQEKSNREIDGDSKSVIAIDLERLSALRTVIDEAQVAIFHAELAKEKLLSEHEKDTESVIILLDEIIKQNVEICRQIISFARFNLNAEDWVTPLRKSRDELAGKQSRASDEKKEP